MASELLSWARGLLFTIPLLGAIAAWAYFEVHFLSRRRARREVKTIAQAIRKYVEEYGWIPVVDGKQNEQPAARIIAILRGANSYSRCESAAQENLPNPNPKEINFIGQLSGMKWAKVLSSRDPWGREYHIALCRDLSEKTEISFRDSQIWTPADRIQIFTRSERDVSVTVHSPLAVWSDGPNGKNQCGYGDNICSWM